MKWKIAAVAAAVGVVMFATPAYATSELEPSGALLLNKSGQGNDCHVEWENLDVTPSTDVKWNATCQRGWDNLRASRQTRILEPDFQVGALVRSFTYVWRNGVMGTGSSADSSCVTDQSWAPGGRIFVHRVKVTVWDDGGPRYRATVDTLIRHPMC